MAASRKLSSLDGPSFVDIFTTIKEIEKWHHVVIFVTLSAGAFNGPCGFATISAMRTAEIGEASVLGEPILALSGEWPCNRHNDLQGCLYAGLLEVDHLLTGKVWEQKIIPFTE